MEDQTPRARAPLGRILGYLSGAGTAAVVDVQDRVVLARAGELVPFDFLAAARGARWGTTTVDSAGTCFLAGVTERHVAVLLLRQRPTSYPDVVRRLENACRLLARALRHYTSTYDTEPSGGPGGTSAPAQVRAFRDRRS